MPAANERMLHYTPENRQGTLAPVDFTAGVDQLAYSLLGRQVVLLDGDSPVASVHLMELEPFGVTETETHRKIGIRYSNAFTSVVVPGMVFVPPMYEMKQTLIAALDNGERGACVRVHRANRVNLQTGEVVPMKNEGDVALALGLMRNEILRIQQSENPNTLYLIPTGQTYDPDNKGSQSFSADMERFFGEFFEPEE